MIVATRDNARILGMEDKLGTLEVGKLADVLVAEGNPLEGLEALVNVAQVFRDGHEVVRGGVVQPTPPKFRVPADSGDPAGR